MYNAQQPAANELPTTAQLLKSTIIALVGAIAILLTIILPSEFGIDPTGIGNALGLKKMGEIKMSLEAELEAEKAAAAAANAPILEEPTKSAPAPKKSIPAAAPAIEVAPSPVVAAAPDIPATPEWRDLITFSLQPDAAVEIKAIMKKGETLSYRWASDQGKTNYDIHGDSKALNIRYHNYEKGSVPGKDGSITADFDGAHGWFWRNRSGKLQNLKLEVRGSYEKLVRVK